MEEEAGRGCGLMMDSVFGTNGSFFQINGLDFYDNFTTRDEVIYT